MDKISYRGEKMSRIAIVTDSTADLPENYIKEYNINIVPLKVFFGDKEYKDWIELKPEQFYKLLKEGKHFPRTSQPSPAEFEGVYKNLAQRYDTIISLHISGKLSGTYQSALVAKQMVNEADIEVIDTQVTSMALGYIVLEAARAAQKGLGKKDILEIIKRVKENIKVFFVVDTLKYLEKGGRIGKARAFLGSLLNIKPVLTLEEGLVAPVEKVRGRSKAFKSLINKIHKYSKKDQPLKISIMHGNNLEGAEKLKEEIIHNFHVEEIIVAELGAVIGTYTGPGTLAVTFLSS